MRLQPTASTVQFAAGRWLGSPNPEQVLAMVRSPSSPVAAWSCRSICILVGVPVRAAIARPQKGIAACYRSMKHEQSGGLTSGASCRAWQKRLGMEVLYTRTISKLAKTQRPDLGMAQYFPEHYLPENSERGLLTSSELADALTIWRHSQPCQMRC
ncbi:MAG: hypothetical protein IPN76_19730 [Saprospiraceae bacterium]|nr:hypothetical protein [Saprospiraceae bacterium]